MLILSTALKDLISDLCLLKTYNRGIDMVLKKKRGRHAILGHFFTPPPPVMLFNASFNIVGHADPNAPPPPSGMASFMDGPTLGISKGRLFRVSEYRFFKFLDFKQNRGNSSLPPPSLAPPSPNPTHPSPTPTPLKIV